MAANFSTKHSGAVTLENERSAGITKVKNNLGVWEFFKYIYGKYVFRLIGLNFLMLAFLVPAYIISINFDGMIIGASRMLPYSNSFGLGLAPWNGIEEYLLGLTVHYNTQKALWLLLGIPVVTVAISGGFAVVRDSYWTGRLHIIKPFFKGVYKTGLHILPVTVVVALMFFGMNFFNIASNSLPAWIAITVKVILYGIIALFAAWGFVYSGVVTLYDQSVKQNIISSFRLCVRYAVPVLFRFVFSVAIFVLLWTINSSFIYVFALTMICILGMFYFALIWMVFMLRICAAHTITGQTLDATVEDAETKTISAKKEA